MKRIVSIILILAMVMGLVSCTQAQNSNAGTSTAAASSEKSTLHKIMERGVLNVGMVANFTPYSYLDEKGNYIGYEVDLAQKIADSLGVKLNIIEVTNDAKITSLETGKVDISWGSATPTLARRQKVGFTDPYVVDATVIAIRDTDSYTSILDLPQGSKVGVTKGSTSGELIETKFPNVVPVYFESPSDAITALQGKQIEATVDGVCFLDYQCTLYDGIKVVGESLASMDYNAMMIPLDDYVWAEYLNLFVWNMNVTGENAALYEKWFGSPPKFALNPEF